MKKKQKIIFINPKKCILHKLKLSKSQFHLSKEINSTPKVNSINPKKINLVKSNQTILVENLM